MKNANKPTAPDRLERGREVTDPQRLDVDPDRHLIQLQLAKPPQERTHFLRVPLANGGSCI